MKKLFAVSLLLVACAKDAEKPHVDPSPLAAAASSGAPSPGVSSPAASLLPSSTVSPTSASSPTASAPGSGSGSGSASGSKSASASGSASALADGKDGRAGGAAGAGGLRAASAHIDGKNFAIDVSSPGCRVGSECAMTITLAAAADYHVNKEYPYKFIASASPGIMYLGKKDANTFAKDTGDFVEQGEKKASLTVRFKPASAGEAKIAGTYKLSVCSAEQCQIEMQPVALAIPVL